MVLTPTNSGQNNFNFNFNLNPMFARPCPGRCPLSTSEYFSNSHFVILIPPLQVTEFYADSNTKVSELFILNIRQEDTGNYFCRWKFYSGLWIVCKIVGIVDNSNCYVSSWNSPFSTAHILQPPYPTNCRREQLLECSEVYQIYIKIVGNVSVERMPLGLPAPTSQ